MKIDIITNIIIPIVSGVTMFFVGKRGRVVQVDSTEINNLREIIRIQQETIDFLSERVSKLEEEVLHHRNARK